MAFGQVQTQATPIKIDRTGVNLLAGGHFQGTQRVPAVRELLVMTSSSNEEAYFVECVMTDGKSGNAHPPVKMAVGWAGL